MTKKERGSALLVSLMVMVGLSLLGLAFVAITETESAISVNERNSVQTKAVAEAGLKTVIEWFQDPEWAIAQGLMPTNEDEIKTVRELSSSMTYTGRYKSDAGQLLFDKPFKPAANDRLYGTRDTADVIINATTLAAAGGAAASFLDDLNEALFADTTQGGRIVEIRVFAPPIVGGTVNADGFWEAGQRLGLATIEVTAMKCRNDSAATPCTVSTSEDEIISQISTRGVVSEWPFPGPSGPVQTNADLNTNGNLRVHWGMITATGTMDLKRPFGSIPWHDAWTWMEYQYGYYDHPSHAGHADVLAHGGPQFQVDSTSTGYDRYNWFNEIVAEPIQDPWYQARSRGDYAGDGAATTYVPYKYNDPATQEIWEPAGGGGCDVCRSIFQFQTTNLPPDIRSVLFPKIDYDFWKEIATSSDDQDGIYYLSWVAGDTFQDRSGNTGTFREWTDTQTASPDGTGNSKAGFYFFDTQNSQNPQNSGPGTLTPAISMNGIGGYQMQGFIYVNTANFKVTGAGPGGPSGLYNMPGEPYKDVGHWRVDESTGTFALDTTVTPNVLIIDGVNDGKWTYQDLDDDDKFDFFVESRPLSRADGTSITVPVPVQWYPGCTPGTNCSEPHEPYLNLIYPAPGNAAGTVTAGWEPMNNQTRRSKKTDNDEPNGTAITCASTNITEASPEEDCTTNGYDVDGALVTLEPILNGVFYTEGEFETTGNNHWFGSVLVQGDASKAGTPDVWFDERLIKGEWPPKEFKFPRVYVSAVQTDQ